jgi:hypothetical protein
MTPEYAILLGLPSIIGSSLFAGFFLGIMWKNL